MSKNRNNFEAAMVAYEELYNSQLLCSTEATNILDRIKYKYKLSPFKYLREKRKTINSSKC